VRGTLLAMCGDRGGQACRSRDAVGSVIVCASHARCFDMGLIGSAGVAVTLAGLFSRRRRRPQPGTGAGAPGPTCRPGRRRR
jgi:hypothetical protein